MKLGCAAWNWLAENRPYEWTIPEIARLGFAACGLQCDREGEWSIYDYFTPAKARELRVLAGDHELDISELVIWGRDLNSPDPAARDKNIDEVRRAVDLAGELEAPLVTTTVPRPTGARFTQIVKRRSNLPAGYDYARDWGRYVDSMSLCLEYAQGAGRSIMLEAFSTSLCSTADAFLRLAAEVTLPTLGFNLDTCHQAIQGQDVALTVYKLRDRILHCHIKDSDSLPAGMGIIDYEEMIGALQAVGFEGVLSIEAEKFDQTTRYVRAAKRHIESILDGRW